MIDSASKYVSLVAVIVGLVMVWLRPGQEDLLKVDTVISSLLKYEAKYVEENKPRIAVGYGACKDLFVTGSHMLANVSYPAHPENFLGVRCGTGDYVAAAPLCHCIRLAPHQA